MSLHPARSKLSFIFVTSLHDREIILNLVYLILAVIPIFVAH